MFTETNLFETDSVDAVTEASGPTDSSPDAPTARLARFQGRVARGRRFHLRPRATGLLYWPTTPGRQSRTGPSEKNGWSNGQCRPRRLLGHRLAPGLGLAAAAVIGLAVARGVGGDKPAEEQARLTGPVPTLHVARLATPRRVRPDVHHRDVSAKSRKRHVGRHRGNARPARKSPPPPPRAAQAAPASQALPTLSADDQAAREFGFEG